MFFSVSWLDLPCALDREWVPHGVCFFQWPDLILLVCWTDSEWPLHGQVFTVSWLDPLSALDRKWVPLALSVYFSVLTWPSLCMWQSVSAPCMVCFFQWPYLTLPVRSTVGECPSRGLFLSLFWLDSPLFSRKWFLLLWLLFCVLTFFFLSYYYRNWDHLLLMYCHYFTILFVWLLITHL